MEPVGQGVPKKMQKGRGRAQRCLFSTIWRAWLPFVISRSRVQVASLAPERKGSLIREPFSFLEHRVLQPVQNPRLRAVFRFALMWQEPVVPSQTPPPFSWQLGLRKATDSHPDPQAESTRNNQKSPESRRNQLSGDFGLWFYGCCR